MQSASTIANAPAASRPTRVTHVVRSLDMGGQEMMVARLVERLSDAGIQCSVVALQSGGPLVQQLRDLRIPVHCLGAGNAVSPRLIPVLARVLWQEGADVVHCHNFQPFLYAGIASLLKPGARLMVTAHGHRTWQGGGRLQAIVQRLFQRAGAVTAVTPDLLDRLRERGCPDDGRLQVVTNGIDTDVFCPTLQRDKLRQTLSLSDYDLAIGAVGRLCPEKNHAALIEAMAVVAAREPRARLVLAGDGPLRAELEQLAARLGLGERVRFLGERGDVLSILGALDVYALPSLTEGTSLSLLEAMACGLPVVATAVGGTPAVVDGGAAARLVSPTPAALADGLLEVLTHPADARRLGETARRIVTERYSIHGMVDAYATLYARLTSRASATNAASCVSAA